MRRIVERWFLLMISPLAGRPLSGAVVTHFDITERTKAQHAMQRSSELLKAVITGTRDHVFVKDLDGRYLLCNEALGEARGPQRGRDRSARPTPSSTWSTGPS